MFVSIIIFILILSLLIFVHELGHFVFAKMTGVKVEEFAIGFPPRIWEKQKGETLYSIGAIPFGGFNKLYGETSEVAQDKDRSFSGKPVRVRALISFGGVLFNVLLAAVIFYFILSSSGFQTKQFLIYDFKFPFGQQENFIATGAVVKNSPAEIAGIEPRDLILQVNGKEFKNTSEFIEFIQEKKGKEINLVLRNAITNENKNINIVPRIEYPDNQGPLGVSLGNIAQVSYVSPANKIFSGFLHSANISVYSFSGLAYFIKESFQEKNIAPLASSVSGPVGIFSLVDTASKMGFATLMNLTAVISLALAMFNILPIPALDGGKLVFLAIEAVARKPVPQKIEENITMFFFGLLILMMLAATFNDLHRFF